MIFKSYRAANGSPMVGTKETCPIFRVYLAGCVNRTRKGRLPRYRIDKLLYSNKITSRLVLVGVWSFCPAWITLFYIIRLDK